MPCSRRRAPALISSAPALFRALPGIELLPLYRCIGLMHRDEPWRLRKSWWLPGAGAARGQVVWLRRYYPSLYSRLVSWIEGATLFG